MATKNDDEGNKLCDCMAVVWLNAKHRKSQCAARHILSGDMNKLIPQVKALVDPSAKSPRTPAVLGKTSSVKPESKQQGINGLSSESAAEEKKAAQNELLDAVSPVSISANSADVFSCDEMTAMLHMTVTVPGDPTDSVDDSEETPLEDPNQFKLNPPSSLHHTDHQHQQSPPILSVFPARQQNWDIQSQLQFSDPFTQQEDDDISALTDDFSSVKAGGEERLAQLEEQVRRLSELHYQHQLHQQQQLQIQQFQLPQLGSSGGGHVTLHATNVTIITTASPAGPVQVDV